MMLLLSARRGRNPSGSFRSKSHSSNCHLGIHSGQTELTQTEKVDSVNAIPRVIYRHATVAALSGRCRFALPVGAQDGRAALPCGSGPACLSKENLRLPRPCPCSLFTDRAGELTLA